MLKTPNNCLLLFSLRLLKLSKEIKHDFTNLLEPSGDMLQQFLITIFDKLDRGNPWDDDFELNNLLQVIHVANLLSC